MPSLKIAVVLIFPTLVACAATPAKNSDAAAGTEGCHTPLGFIPEGSTATGYLHPVENGGPCQQGALTCTDGVWSGPYIYPSCTSAP